MGFVRVSDGSQYRRVPWQLPSDEVPDPPDPPPPTDPGAAAIIAGAGFRPDVGDLEPSGHITVTSDNAVIEGYDISGGVSIKANNVTLRDNRIRGYNGVFLVRYYPGFNEGVVEYNEIEGLDSPTDPLKGTNAAIGGTENPVGLLWQYNHVHGNTDGMKPGTGALVYRNHMNVFKKPGSTEHRDCLQISGRSNIVVQENVAELDMDTGGNTGLFAQAWSNANIPISGIDFINNYCYGGNRGLEMSGGKDSKPLPPGFDNIDELITNCKCIGNKLFGPFRHSVFVIANAAAHEIHDNLYEGLPYP